MKATYACVRGVQGDGKIDHMGEGGRVRGDVMFFALDPASMRVDVMSSAVVGVHLATLTADSTRFTMLDVRNKMFLHGPPTACNIARLTQVAIPPHALVKLLRGEAPLLAHDASAPRIEWDHAGYYVVTIPSLHEAVQEVRLEPLPEDFLLPYSQQRVRVLHVSVRQREYVHYAAELSEHRLAHTMPPRTDPIGLDPPIPPSGPPCRAYVPTRIRVVVPYTREDLLVRYEETGLNPPLPDGVFTQPVPGGVRMQRVSCD